jgi:hypothetical protein
MNEQTEFGKLEIGDFFQIPSGLDHEMEEFIKLPFNNARSTQNDRIERFSIHASVWRMN